MPKRSSKIEVGTGVTHIGYTDRTPYEVIRVVSDKTLEIRTMKAELDPAFKPNVIPGGFAGHVTNVCDQKWIITPDPDGRVIRIRHTKRMQLIDGNITKVWTHKGSKFLVGRAVKYYDYNF